MLVAQELCQDQVALLFSQVGNVSEMGHTTYSAACNLSGDRENLVLHQLSYDGLGLPIVFYWPFTRRRARSHKFWLAFQMLLVYLFDCFLPTTGVVDFSLGEKYEIEQNFLIFQSLRFY